MDARGLIDHVRRLLPEGVQLPEADWDRRHRTIAALTWLQAPAVFGYALAQGDGLAHASLEALPVLLLMASTLVRGASRRRRECTTTLALAAASATLVHVSGGLIEMHFHYFLVVALVTLYQQWRPLLSSIALVVVHHGIASAVDPAQVFNHPAAIAHPVRWSAIHLGFMVLLSGVGLANWKLNEVARRSAEDSYRRLYEGERALVERLREADTVKNELLAGVSHEFRSPLTSIVGLAHTLTIPDLPASVDPADLGQRMMRQAQRMQLLVENLLSSSGLRPDVGASAAIGTVLEPMSQLAPQRMPGRALELDVPPALRWPLTEAKASLVLGNLLSNAAKHGRDGTPIRLEASEAAGGVRVTVRNDGPTIPASMLEMMFEPFTQGDASDTRQADGVGLGLHVVRTLARAHDGEVTATSTHGVTTVTVWLPTPSGPATAAAATTARDETPPVRTHARAA